MQGGYTTFPLASINATLVSLQNQISALTTLNIKISLTSAQILLLFTTPITLLPAPGVGKIYEFSNIFARMNFLTAAYATNVNLTLYYNINVAVGQNSNVLTSTSTRTGMITKSAIAGPTIDQYPTNSPFLVTVPIGNPTGGGGSMDIYLTYQILTL